MSSQLLPDFMLQPFDYGWKSGFPNGPWRLFGREVSVEIHTRIVPYRPIDLSPISEKQAALVRKIASELGEIIKRVETELTAYDSSFDSDFQDFITNPSVWLSSEKDDGQTWAFVIERTDNPDFGYHAEFKGTEFIELWGGD